MCCTEIWILILPFPNLESGCTDTPQWTDTDSFTCDGYKTNDWCRNGKALRHPWESTFGGIGSSYNYPEKNCCICGKGKGKAPYILQYT